MTRYHVYRWPGGRPPPPLADPSFQWVAADPGVLAQSFRDDPARLRAQLQMLDEGYIGLVCIARNGWCAYAWMRRPRRPGPPHLPANVRRLDGYWITYCRTRRGYQRLGLFRTALQQLVALALAEDPKAEVYIDSESDNVASHHAILGSGFYPNGVLHTISIGLPRLGHLVLGRLRNGQHPKSSTESIGGTGSSVAGQMSIGLDLERRITAYSPSESGRAADPLSGSWSSRLPRALLAGHFGRSVLVLAGGTALSQGLIIFASPILTRVYNPADFGIYGAALSLITFLTVASSLRYERAIPLPEDERMAACLVAACLLLVGATTAISAVVLVAVGGQIAAFLRAPSLTPILWVLLVAQVGAGTYQVVNSWAVRAGAYSEIARTRVSQSVATLIVQLGLGGVGLTAGGLVIGDAIGRSIGTGRLGIRLWRSNQKAIRSVTAQGIREAFSRYRRFGLLVGPASLLNSVSLQIPSILLLVLYGPTVGGWYLLVQRVGALPAALVSVSAGQVFLGEAARVSRQDPSALTDLFRKTWRSLVAVGVGPILALAVLGPIITPIVFGEAWRQAGLYFTLLAPMLFLQFAIEPITAILVVLERQGLVIVGEIIRVVLMISIWLTAAELKLAAPVTVGLISLGGSLSYLMYFVASRRAVQRKALASAALVEDQS